MKTDLWHSKGVKHARSILYDTEIAGIPQNFVRKTRAANVYATTVKGSIYGMERNIAVNQNPMKALNEREDRDSEFFRIGKELDAIHGCADNLEE